MTDMALGAAGLDLGVYSRGQEKPNTSSVVSPLAMRAPSMANRLADGRWTFRCGHEPDGIVEAMDADTPKCEICGQQKRAAAS